MMLRVMMAYGIENDKSTHMASVHILYDKSIVDLNDALSLINPWSHGTTTPGPVF